MAKKQPTEQAAPQAAATPTHIIVTSTHEGFRRGGRAWSKTPTKVAIEELTQEQLDQINREPLLTVELMQDE